AAEYNRAFADIANYLTLSYEPSWSRAVYHLYVVRIEDRQGFIAHLKSKAIGTAIHYPIPLHLQKAYSSLGYVSGDYPISEKISDRIVSLPMYPQMTSGQQAGVIQESVNFVQRRDIS